MGMWATTHVLIWNRLSNPNRSQAPEIYLLKEITAKCKGQSVGVTIAAIPFYCETHPRKRKHCRYFISSHRSANQIMRETVHQNRGVCEVCRWKHNSVCPIHPRDWTCLSSWQRTVQYWRMHSEGIVGDPWKQVVLDGQDWTFCHWKTSSTRTSDHSPF